MFKVGDYVVVNNHPFKWLCKFDYYCTEGRVMLHKHDRWSKDTAFQTWPKATEVRHATSEEIAAGHRIDLETLRDCDTSPNCKKFDERVK